MGEKRLDALKACILRIYKGLEGRYCLRPTSEKAGIGLRRENFEFPESRILKPSFLGFWTQIGQFWTTFAVTLLLQDQEAELSIPADPARVFHPVWRPQNIFP